MLWKERGTIAEHTQELAEKKTDFNKSSHGCDIPDGNYVDETKKKKKQTYVTAERTKRMFVCFVFFFSAGLLIGSYHTQATGTVCFFVFFFFFFAIIEKRIPQQNIEDKGNFPKIIEVAFSTN